MEDAEKTAFECYCEKFDKKVKSLINVIYALMTIILGGSLILFVTFGEVKTQVKVNTGRIDYVWKDYMPTVFMNGIMKSYDIQTQELIATLAGDKQKVKEINEDFTEFRKEMINTLQQVRGGNTNITRGATK